MKILYFVLILLVVAATVALICFEAFDFGKDKNLLTSNTIYINDEPQLSASVKLEGLVPGESKSYELRLKANTGDGFNIKLAFEKTGECTIAEFVDVEIILNGEVKDKGTLQEYLEGKTTVFPTEFKNSEDIELVIKYSMDITVGDEAQNTSADFDLHLTAE